MLVDFNGYFLRKDSFGKCCNPVRESMVLKTCWRIIRVPIVVIMTAVKIIGNLAMLQKTDSMEINFLQCHSFSAN